LILLKPKDSGTAVAWYSATSCGWWWWTDEEDGKWKQFRWGTIGKKTDNKDFAIKNPDKWGAENNKNDLDSIERSVKDDDPAKAGFFFALTTRVQIRRPARLRIIAARHLERFQHHACHRSPMRTSMAWQVTRSLEMRCT